MNIIIDRIEGEIAVVELENGQMLRLPSSLLHPLGAKEGDVVRLCIDKEQTAARKARAASLLKNLFRE